MSKFIDTDRVIRKYIDTDIDKFSNPEVKIVLENLKQNILKMSGVNVVFCVSCKYWENCIEETFCTRGADLNPQESGWVMRRACDFCSYGERITP